jgi:hypothetical protein
MQHTGLVGVERNMLLLMERGVSIIALEKIAGYLNLAARFEAVCLNPNLDCIVVSLVDSSDM